MDSRRTVIGIEVETGFAVPDQEGRAGVQVAGPVTEAFHFFVAKSQTHCVAEGEVAEEEGTKIIEPPFEEAMLQVAWGEIMDGKTIMLPQLTALHNFNISSVTS